jgi:hypothetical protein
MVRIVFVPVKLYATKTGKCTVCGKYVKRQTIFEQTLNPFNKNKEGIPKNKIEIYKELYIERTNWMKEPIKHKKCNIKEIN